MKLVFVHNKSYEHAETFVKAHVDGLAGFEDIEQHFVCGLPARYQSAPVIGEHLFTALFTHFKNVIRKRRLNLSDYHESSYEKIVRRLKPDVIFVEYGNMGIVLADICRKYNIPLVVHFHGHDAFRKSILEGHESDYRKLFNSAAALISVSRPMTAQLIKLGAPQKKIHLNVYGVESNKIEIEKSEFYICITVGRFVEKKAPYLTIMAFAEALRKHPDYRLKMIGDGPLLPVCKNLVKSMKLDHAITFLGRMTNDEVKTQMRKASVFLQHSIIASDGDSEGTPVAILEAGACGLPVISTRHAGIPDAVIDEETGFLVDELDIESMTENIIRLGENRDLGMAMGRRARQHILENYSMEKSIKGLVHIINKAVKQSND